MERSSCGCGSGKACKMHEGCPNKCSDCKCGCKSHHPCKECKTDKHQNARPKS